MITVRQVEPGSSMLTSSLGPLTSPQPSKGRLDPPKLMLVSKVFTSRACLEPQDWHGCLSTMTPGGMLKVESKDGIFLYRLHDALVEALSDQQFYLAELVN